MTQRHEYRRTLAPDLAAPAAPADLPGALRQPQPGDAEQLAALMLAAYRGTIDDEGETLDDARSEIAGYLAGANNPPLLSCSWLVAQPGAIIAASLICLWRRRAAPLVAYVITQPDQQRRALGRLLVSQSLASLRQAGYAELRAVITAGNQPSERLFGQLGFTRIEEAG